MCRARLAVLVHLFAAFGGCIVAYRFNFNGLSRFTFNGKSNALQDVSVGMEGPLRSTGRQIGYAPSHEAPPERPFVAADAYSSRRQPTRELEALLREPPKSSSLANASLPASVTPIEAIGITKDGTSPAMEEYNALFLLDGSQSISVPGRELPPGFSRGWWRDFKPLDRGTRRHVYESSKWPTHVVKMPITQQASTFMLQESQEAADAGAEAGVVLLQKISRESRVLVLRKTRPSFYKALRRVNPDHPDSPPCVFEVSEKVKGWTLSQLYEDATFRPLFFDIVSLIVGTIDLLIPMADRDKWDFADWRKPNLIVESPISVPLKVTLVDGDFVKMERPQNVSERLEGVALWLNLDGIPEGYDTKEALVTKAKAIQAQAEKLRKPLSTILPK